MSLRRFDVLLGDDAVGQLAETADGQVELGFRPSYRDLPDRPVLGQRFEDDLTRTYRGKKGALPAFFANLAPEGRLREVIERSAGLEPGDARRYAPEGSRVLAIRRYDRDEGRRIHQEDFAQVVGLPPSRKYDQVTYEAMAVLTGGILGPEGIGEFLRRLVLVIACGNNDAHLKNWSLVYPDGRRACWSPLYDQVATVAWEGLDRTLALKLAGAKELGRLDLRAFERLAQKAHLDAGRVRRLVAETLERLRGAWDRVHAELPLPPEHAAALSEHWRRVPLLRDAFTRS